MLLLYRKNGGIQYCVNSYKKEVPDRKIGSKLLRKGTHFLNYVMEKNRIIRLQL